MINTGKEEFRYLQWKATGQKLLGKRDQKQVAKLFSLLYFLEVLSCGDILLHENFVVVSFSLDRIFMI